MLPPTAEETEPAPESSEVEEDLARDTSKPTAQAAALEVPANIITDTLALQAPPTPSERESPAFSPPAQDQTAAASPEDTRNAPEPPAKDLTAQVKSGDSLEGSEPPAMDLAAPEEELEPEDTTPDAGATAMDQVAIPGLLKTLRHAPKGPAAQLITSTLRPALEAPAATNSKPPKLQFTRNLGRMSTGRPQSPPSAEARLRLALLEKRSLPSHVLEATTTTRTSSASSTALLDGSKTASSAKRLKLSLFLAALLDSRRSMDTASKR